MDTTHLDRTIDSLAAADPADAPDIADALAAEMAELLDPEEAPEEEPA